MCPAHSHHFRQSFPTFREQRLVGRMTFETPTQLAERVASSLPEGRSRELLRRIKEAPPESEIVAAVQESLADLKEEERVHINGNLRDLTHRTTETGLTALQEFVEHLRANLERREVAVAKPLPEPEPAIPPPTREAPVPVEKRKQKESKGLLDYIGWNKLSPEAKERAKDVGKIAAVTAVTGFFLWGISKLLKGGKKTVEVVQEGGRKTWSFLKWLFVGALLTGLGYGAWKLAEKYKEIAALGKKIEDFVGKTAGEAKEQWDALKREYEDVRVVFNTTTQEGREKLMKKMHDLETKFQGLKDKEGEEGGVNFETLAEKAPPPIALIAPAIVFLEGPNVDWGEAISTDMQKKKVNDALSWFAKNGVAMKDLFACMRGDTVQAGAVQKLLGPLTEFKSEQARLWVRKAGEAVVLFCVHHRPQMLRLYGKDSENALDALPVEEYLQQCGGTYRALDHLMSSAKTLGVGLFDKGTVEGKQAWEGFVQALHEYKDPHLTVSLRELLPQWKGDEDIFKDLSLTEMLSVALSKGEGTVTTYLGTMVDEVQVFEALREKKIGVEDALKQAGITKMELRLYRLCQRIMDEPPDLLPFFHEIFPNGELTGETSKDREKVKQYLTEHMSLAEAVRFALYDRMTHRGHALGVILTQMETLRFLMHADPSWLGAKKYRLAYRLAKMLASNGYRRMLELCEGVSSEEVDRVLAQIYAVMSETARLLGGVAINFFLGGFKEGTAAIYGIGEEVCVDFLQWAAENPEYSLPTSGASLLGGWLYFRRMRRIYSQPFEFGRALERAGEMRGWNPLKTFKRETFAATRQNAGAAVKELAAKLQGVGKVTEETSEGQKVLHNFLFQSGRQAGDVAALETELCKLAGGTLDKEVVDKINVLKDPEALAAVRNFRFLRRPVYFMGRRLKEVRYLGAPRIYNEWVKASPWQRVAYVGGVGAQGLMLYEDWETIDDMKEQKKQAEEHASEVLVGLRQRFEADDRFEKISDGVFKHKSSGVEVSLRAAQAQLQTLEEGLSDRVLAQRLRTATSAGSLVLTLYMGAKVFSGPAGIAVAGAEIAIRTGINAWEEGKMRKFIVDCPPWLLAALGTQQTIGTSEYDMLANASSWMLSDIFIHPETTKQKVEIRKKMFFAIFNYDLRAHVPELCEEVTAGMDSPQQLDRFFETDFQSIILPFFYIRLFQIAKSDAVTWELLKQGKIDSGLVVLPPDVTLVEIRRAMRDSVVLYQQYLREKRYLEHCELLKGQEDNEDLRALVEDLGTAQVFGQELREATLNLQAGGKTRAELLMAALQQQVEDYQTVDLQGTPRKGKQWDPSLFRVTAAKVPGLPQDLDLGRDDAILGFVEDPGLRLKLQQAFPENLEEEEAEKQRRWNDWMPNLRDALKYPSDTRLRQIDQVKYSLPFAAANTIAKALTGKPFYEEKPGLIDMIFRTRSGEGPSYDEAKKYVTDGTVALTEHAREKHPPRYERDDNLAKKLYGASLSRPLVFLSGSAEERYFRELARPAFPDEPPEEFSLGNLRAVFFDCQKLGGTDQAVLATYVYGDLESRRVSIIRCAAATAMLSNTPSVFVERGHLEPVTAQEFSVASGMENLLEKAREEWERDRPKRDQYIAEQKRREDKESIEAQSEKEQRHLEDERKRSEALAQAKEQPRILHPYDAGTYVTYYPEHGFLYLRVPRVSTGPAWAEPSTPRAKGKHAAREATEVSYEGRFHTVHGDYVTYAEKNGIPSGAFTEVLITPIPENPRASIRKLLAVFVADIESREAAAMEDQLLPLYQELATDDVRRLFLSELRTRIYQATRKAGKPSSEWTVLTKRIFEREVLPGLQRGSGRKAA